MRHERSSVLWFVFLAVGLTAGCQSGPRVQKASAARMVTPVLAILRSPPVRRAITNSFESRRRTLDLFLGRNGRNRELEEPPPADEPTSDRDTHTERGTKKPAQLEPEGGGSQVHLAAVSSGTASGRKHAVDGKRKAPEASLTPSTSSGTSKSLPAGKVPAPDGLAVGLSVLWLLALATRPFDKPMTLAVVYCGLVFGEGRYGEFPVVETILVTGISFVLGLGLFWILHKARRSNPWWLSVCLLGPIAIQAMWVLPGILAG